METLTIDQEIELLDKAGSFIANGSSRAVYEIEYNGKPCVLKVYLDRAGEIQTSNEIEMWKNYAGMFANIYAVGHCCIVAEKVDDVDCIAIEDAFAGASYEEYEEDKCGETELSESEYEELCGLIGMIEDALGENTDNDQIGFSQEQNIFVAYDYGYTSDMEFEEQVGSMSDYICELGNRGVLSAAIHMIAQEMPFEERWGMREYDYEGFEG